jgi:hypothetical protein
MICNSNQTLNKIKYVNSDWKVNCIDFVSKAISTILQSRIKANQKGIVEDSVIYNILLI